jgi:NAD(P)-dependent dehydrogenase (short-subunit alcohol dehydrogenase family)
MHELKGKVALVTGGGGGLGAAICRSLGAAGATVAVADVRLDAAQKVAHQLREQDVKAVAAALDVGDESSAAQVLNQLIQREGKLDILVNNAGTDVTLPIDELTFADWDRVVRVNLRGPFVLSKIALPHMKEHRRGHIVNIVSTAAKRTWPNASAYHASKWGLLGLSHAMHTEARQYGVKVTAVIAGGMRTPFILDRFPDTPLNVLQDPGNVADTVRFVLTLPDESVIPEIMVLPMRETSWP